MKLKDKTISGITWSFIENIGVKIVSTSTFFLLAKLLGADALGLVAIINGIIQISNLFIDQGLGLALIQRKVLKNEHLNTVLVINIFFGFLLYILLYFLAPYISTLYDTEQLTNLLRVAALTFLISPASIVHNSICQREFKYKKITKSRIIGILIGSAVGIGMALSGFGVWALIVQQLCFISLYTLVLWYLSPWVPTFKVTRIAFKDVFSFSYKVFLNEIVARMSNNSTELIIGYFLGAEAAGIYLFTKKIFQATIELINSSINNIMTPLFSAIQDDMEKLRSYFCRLIQNLYYILIPACIALVCCGPLVIRTFFEEEWQASTDILLWISIGGTIHLLYLHVKSISIGVGRPDVILKFNLLNAIINIFLVTLAAQFNLFWVAISMFIRPIIILPFVLFLLSRLIDLRVKRFFTCLKNPLILGIMLVIIVLSISYLPISSLYFLSSIQLITGLLATVILSYFMKAEWIDFIKNFTLKFHASKNKR